MAQNDLYKLANNHIMDKLEKIFGIKRTEGYEKFKQTFESDEVSRELRALYSQAQKALILGLNKDNAVMVVHKETRYSKKAVLILKCNKEESLSEDLFQNFLFIELSKQMLDQMHVMCKDIFYPILSHTVYQDDTSELISKDLIEKFHNFLSRFYVCLGHIQGKTWLPIPSDDILKNPKINDNEKTQMCEGAVIMWIELIKHILKQEPEYEFRNGQNPRPFTEIKFWNNKSESLKLILSQIQKDSGDRNNEQAEKVLDILKFLEKQKSSYFKLFNETKREVVQKEREATVNAWFLNFIKNDFEQLENMNSDIPTLSELFVPIFYIIKLIWKDNEYYSKPERLIVLLRKICNVIIDQASREVNTNIFSKIHDSDLIGEAIEKLVTVRAFIQNFMAAYTTYKDQGEEWKISRNVVFYRLDAFFDRIGDILNIARSYNEFVIISNKSIGGIKGHKLEETLKEIFNQASAAVKKFISNEYNCLDISSDVFNTKYTQYKETLKELEKRIAAVLTQTFDENDTIIGKFKVLENFDSILERPNIVCELEKKYNILLELYKTELRTVQMLYITGKEYIEKHDPRSPLNKNMPPVAAMLMWVDSLKERIKEPYARFVAIGEKIVNKEEFKEIEKLYNSIIKLLLDYEDLRKKEWEEQSKSHSGNKQKDYILTKKDDLIRINFDPNLLQLLKEIKYFKILNLPIPKEAEDVYAKNSTFKKHIASLENITVLYNNVICSLIEVEKPLVQEKLKKVQNILEPGFSSITWEKTKEIEDFVAKAHINISDLGNTVDRLKAFVAKIEHILREWKEKTLFIRPENVQDAPTLSAAFIANFEKDKNDMGMKCKDLTSVTEVLNALKSAVSSLENLKKTPAWDNYRHYINNIVLRGFIDMIYSNLENLHNTLDPSLDAFCSVKLMLSSRKVIFEPDLSSEGETSIKGMILRWVDNFINLSTLPKNRIDTAQGDYLLEVLESFKIQEITYKLTNEVNDLIKDSDNIIGSFKEYEMLWEKDFEAGFSEFLKQNTELPLQTPEKAEEDEKIANIFGKENPLNNIVIYTPSKDVFDEKINEFKNMLNKIKKMDKEKKVRWVLVDFSIFRNDLATIVGNWVKDYKDFLWRNSTKKFSNIKNFVGRVKSGTTNIPSQVQNEADKQRLTQVLEVIYDSKVLFPTLERLIPKIVDELEILKKHSKNEDEEDDDDEEKDANSEEQKLINQTMELKQEIVVLKKNVDDVCQNINDLVEIEASNFKEEVKAFEQKVEKYRADFVANLPYKIEFFNEIEIKEAYAKLDNYYIELKHLEEKRKENNRMERLLNLSTSQNKQINDCLNDLKLCKVLWDYISLCYHSFENWKKMKWDKVNPDEFSEKVEVYKLMLGRNLIRKELKQISAFQNLIKRVQNMDDIVTIIKTLKDRAIKTRHWKNLMKTINKQIPYDSSDFSVENLIELEMYKEKDKCEDEKQIAQSQVKIEDAYNKIEKFWKSAEFKFIADMKYEFSIFDLLKMDGVIETLEKDQIVLSTFNQNKAILENFEDMGEKMDKMLSKLKTMRSVLGIWMKLQKKWEKLEPIFKADDIQKTLRNEYEDFRNLNFKFKDEMKHASEINTIIEVCTEEKELILVDMTDTINKCEYALEAYLTNKKNIFPRFYFLSNDTLLNMLSHSDYPNIINKNVKDCFDGIKSWKMTPKNEQGKSDTVISMLSSENDEEVVFEEPFVCKDLVERYLNDFERKMRDVLKQILYNAYTSVEWMSFRAPNLDKKNIIRRHKWVDPYPAQIALLVSMAYWTEEVEQTFLEMDSGAEGKMKEYYKISCDRITELIDRVKGDKELIKNRDKRVKVITIITVDVHGRDVIASLIDGKITDVNNFNWKKQLRFYYSTEKRDCNIRIADYQTTYSYEYIGNTGRLVITPLTDRCYITLTQALNLYLGGAPAGPAGTGKTETTKDLGRNLGLGVIVNNCSDQMTIDTTLRIFTGLAQTGFWGCFDEFNRISIEVLSVVAQQVKDILNALRAKQTQFNYQGQENIKLVHSCGMFITMNPGYAGRTELPDNLKASFRWCAMVVPNLDKICENMLMSEGFNKAQIISSKFITLYSLSADLLSKQKHYDWGLRAIKSLLRQAGGLKRNELNADKPEEFIIMKALFDFNKAKIVPDDLPIFTRLLDDLFKDLGHIKEEDVNKDINNDIEQATELAIEAERKPKLTREVQFTNKTRQLYEIMGVRHCIFVLGAPGCGKTSVWQTLFHTLRDIRKEDSAYEKLSPKAIDKDELFGFFDKNKTWHFGVLSSVMQKMCKNDSPYKETQKNKWIIIDGDIDPDWIESLNTVMDDNKVLTLNNGDRFPLDEAMRLIFEISNLRNATLATVSRGGVLYINEKDIGTQPFFEKWLYNNYSNPAVSYNELVRITVQRLKSETFERLRDLKDKHISPIVEIGLLENVCTLFKYLIKENHEHLNDSNIEEDRKKLIVEGLYFFAFMWGAGGSLQERKDMHSIINSLINKKIRLNDTGDCYDCFFDAAKNVWTPWNDLRTNYEFSRTDLFGDIIIPNAEVIRLNRIIEINLLEDRACLFIGDAGTGKTSIVNNFIKRIPTFRKGEITFKCFTINFNSYTDSFVFQNTLESQISPKYGNRFGPINAKQVFFLDDLNMPELDKYGTQSHIELLRQIIDFGECYDRKELDYKKILEDLLFIACQNPKAGSFVIDLRLQRHFNVIATTEPKQDIIEEIYTTILNNHFQHFRFRGNESYEIFSQRIVKASFDILEKFRKKEKSFFPTALKFHYQWNLREISKIVNGLLRTDPKFHTDTDSINRLWLHECNRIFRDRLFVSDLQTYTVCSLATFEILEYKGNKDELNEPFIFVPFDDIIDDENVLVQPKTYEHLKQYIENKLEEHNEVAFNMPLVLFDDAIMHICRIARIISNPSSHALLVGVGGSGKQSLARLAAFIKNTKIAPLNFTGSDYDSEKLIGDLKECVRLSCLKIGEEPYAFLMNDNHIIDEYFLVYINNFLSSGWVDKFYETENDKENDVVKLKNQAIQAEFMLRTEHDLQKMFKYLIYRIKTNIHMILCMSPVGEKLKLRARKFPGLLSCTNIDWFHDWPDYALQKVAKSKIDKIPEFDDEPSLREKLASLTADFHLSVNSFNELFRSQERRFNYTTPKSFLELIEFFKLIVGTKNSEITEQLSRLTNGLKILASTAEKIAQLQIVIEEKTIKVNIQKEISAKDLAEVEVEQEKITTEKVKVEEATLIAQKDFSEAMEAQQQAQKELDDALPVKEQAFRDATNIDKSQLNDFKNSQNPSENYIDIYKLLYFIINPTKKDPKDLNTIRQGYLVWDAQTIKNKLISRIENVDWLDDDFRSKTKKWIEDPKYKDKKAMESIFGPVYLMTSFFHNLIKYKDLVIKIEPLQKTAETAKEKADKSTQNKNELEAKLQVLIDKKNLVEDKYMRSKAEKERVEAEQKELMDKFDMAKKFTSLLSGNEKRWKEDVIRLNELKNKIGGDCILASAFVSYVGVFNNQFRDNLIKKWKELIAMKDIPITPDLDLVRVLITDAKILKFKSEALPDDPFSIANSAIITSCIRWPLVIDPQMQAIRWFKRMELKKSSIQYKEKGWGRKIGEAIEDGQLVLIEDCDDEMDPLLTPLLAKETYKRDKSSSTLYIKLGTDEFVFNPAAKVYLLTKMSNPHYKPEIAAQCTLVNFIVTEKGLEDQLLATVVNTEQPELEETIKRCISEINEYQRDLMQKEDDVLRNLNNADEDKILENVELVQSLEITKQSAQIIEEKSRDTQNLINEIKVKREIYRKVGEEGAMLFFLISKLFVIQEMYQYSLDSFNYFFIKAINGTKKVESLQERVKLLRENIRINIYQWITSSMFERDKQLFLTMIALRLLQKKALMGEELQGITQRHIDFLLRNPKKNECPPKEHVFDWMTESMWKSLNYLSDLPFFEEFSIKMHNEQPGKFKEWYNELTPETVPLPLQWRQYKVSSFQKLLVLACCRPDRIGVAINEFVKESLPDGKAFLEPKTFSEILMQAYSDSTTDIPIFFILSPGSNPSKELEMLKKKLEGNKKTIRLKEIAMGQKADIEAVNFLMDMNVNGGWLFLQNIHLMPKWLKTLQDILKQLAKEKGNDDFRLFLSAEPRPEIPVGILEKCIKLTNEPPSGLKENMKIAFNILRTENPNMEEERKRANIAFGLCYYHAVVIERKKFGSLGWNRNYPFSLDDLRNSDMVVGKYLETNMSMKIPYDDLRYIVGEIMYGGHIVDDWDRILNMAYLEYLFVDKIHEDLELIPYPSASSGFKLSLKSPANNANLQFNKWGEYIDTAVTSESPALFGLHPNAELDFRTQQAARLFQNLIDLEPKDSGSGAGEETEQSKAERLAIECEDIGNAAADGIIDISRLLGDLGDEKTPFQNVFLQECEQLSLLCSLVKKDTSDLRDALEGKLTMTDKFERLRFMINTQRVPDTWLSNGFATQRKLPLWKKSLQLRIHQYGHFVNERTPPKITFINRLFNPLSYLTAIKQVYAQLRKAELDKLVIITEPTNLFLNNNKSQFNEKEYGGGTLVYGMHLQGARWDEENRQIDESKPREEYCIMPVISCQIKEVTTTKIEENKGYYICPVYKTTQRDATYVCKAQFKTKHNPAKWIIAGVAVILDVVDGDETPNFLK
jgi:dynein heavy chain